MAALELPNDAADDSGSADRHERDTGLGSLWSALGGLAHLLVGRARRRALDSLLVALSEP